MLTFFTMKRSYHKLAVTLHFDLEAREAEVTVTYDRIIQRSESVPFWNVETVDKATAWLCRPCGIHGNFIEALEWSARRGLLAASVAA